MCKLAEQANRFEDMANNIGQIIYEGCRLTNEERNFFSVAFKNILGQKRASLRVLANFEKEEETKSSPQQRNLVLLRNYREKIVQEINQNCHQVLKFIEILLKSAVSSEEKVFFHKLRGDYYKYISEVSKGEEKTKAVEASIEAYDIVQNIVNTEYNPADPILLGNALSFSVFTYEVLQDPIKACQIAKQAFDQGFAGLETLENDKYKDSSMILLRIRDNLTEWNNNLENKIIIQKD